MKKNVSIVLLSLSLIGCATTKVDTTSEPRPFNMPNDKYVLASTVTNGMEICYQQGKVTSSDYINAELSIKRMLLLYHYDYAKLMQYNEHGKAYIERKVKKLGVDDTCKTVFKIARKKAIAPYLNSYQAKENPLDTKSAPESKSTFGKIGTALMLGVIAASQQQQSSYDYDNNSYQQELEQQRLNQEHQLNMIRQKQNDLERELEIQRQQQQRVITFRDLYPNSF